jgi:DAK2 domain fusion protein YloV
MSDLEQVLKLARAATTALERNRQRIDDLNVYPVPDGDTGTNMTMTARAVVEELERSTATDRPALVKEVTRAALMGARGNSGVILSQIVRGAAEVLGSEAQIDAAVVARAFQGARDAAYRAVREPVEGTMLSVIRELAEETESHTPAADIPSLLATLVGRGEEALARTPEQLDVLRDAGVVDAGGAGLLEIVRGLAAAVAGEELPEAPAEREHLSMDAIHQELSRYRYCTTFVIEGGGLDADELEQELAQLGDSLLVVGDPEALKVHVHTDDPGAALAIGTRVGVIERVEIANMHEQTVKREERLLHAVEELPSTAVVAVVAGDGNRRLFESFGAHIVEGGQSMNPSVGDLSEALDPGLAPEVIVLPNNSNVIETARQAAYYAQVNALVVPTRSMQEGLSAMVAFDPAESGEKNASSMQNILTGVVTGEVTVASRAAQLNGLAIKAGDYLGLAGDEAIATGPNFDEVAAAVADRLLAEPRGVLTLLTGADEPELDGLLKRIEASHPDLELDVQSGGQPHYPLLLSAE